MSDNIRTALYDADYSCTLAYRAAPGRRRCSSRVVGKHCEAGDIVVKDEFLPGDVAPGDLVAVPGTGAYCWSMASNYNHLLRPPVVAVRDGEVAGPGPTRDRGRPAGDRHGSDTVTDKPLKVAVLGCGSVGSQVVRLLEEQSGDLAARIGAPLELVGVAVRRLDAPREVDVPDGLLTTDAEGLVPRRRRPRRRGDRRHRAGPLA